MSELCPLDAVLSYSYRNSCSGPLLRLSASSQSHKRIRWTSPRPRRGTIRLTSASAGPSTFAKFLNIDGSISISGEVDADALAHATLDDKQIVDGNSVEFEDYQNAYRAPRPWVHRIRGARSRSGRRPTTEEGAPHPATVHQHRDGRWRHAGECFGQYRPEHGGWRLQRAGKCCGHFFGGTAWTAAAQPKPAASRCRTCTTTASTITSYELENTDIRQHRSRIGAGLANGADGNIGVNGGSRCVQHPEERSGHRDGHGRQSRRSHGRHASGRRREQQRPRRHDQQREHRRVADWRFG